MGRRGAIRELWTPEAFWFWSRVEKTGPLIIETRCWIWARWIGDKGYGMVRSGDKATLMAHRVAWELTNGKILDGKLVLHRCDNRACVRPDHLFLGDDKTNADDCIQKGRANKPRGERQHLAKLTEVSARQIKLERSWDPPTPLADLAERYGVTKTAISLCALGKTWKHLSPT